ncbi:hypothetical protein ACEQPO_04225 [Bacillus sp. SL00103]
MEQSKLIKDTDITVDQKKNHFFKRNSFPHTNSDYAEVIGLNFAKTLAIGASTEKENNLHKPENDSLGALYSFLRPKHHRETRKTVRCWQRERKKQMKNKRLLGKEPHT